MSKKVDFDPSEWREILPGIFSLKSDPQKLCFECVAGETPEPLITPKQKENREEAIYIREEEKGEEAKVEEGQE